MAMTFNGTSHNLRVASNTLFNFTPSVTLMAWINNTSTSLLTLNQRIFSRYLNAATANEQYGIDLSNGVPRLLIGTNTAVTNLMAPSAVSTGIWYHIAGTYDGATMVLYVNGVSVASQARSGVITSSTGGISVASDYNGTASSEYFSGSLEDIKLYSRALSADEIQTIAISRGTTNIRNSLVLNLLLDESRRGTTLAANAVVYDTGPYKLNATSTVAGAVFSDGFLRKRKFS